MNVAIQVWMESCGKCKYIRNNLVVIKMKSYVLWNWQSNHSCTANKHTYTHKQFCCKNKLNQTHSHQEDIP